MKYKDNVLSIWSTKKVIILLVVFFALIWGIQALINSYVASKALNSLYSMKKESSVKWTTKKFLNEINDSYYTFAECSSNNVNINGQDVSIRLIVRRDNEGEFVPYFIPSNPNFNNFSEITIILEEDNKTTHTTQVEKEGDVYKIQKVAEFINCLESQKPFQIEIKNRKDNSKGCFRFEPYNNSLK